MSIESETLIVDSNGVLVCIVNTPHSEKLRIALCTLINAQNADVGKLAEEYAEKKHSNSDPKNALLNTIKEDLIDAVLYGSTLNWAEEKKEYEYQIEELKKKNERLYNQVSYLER